MPGVHAVLTRDNCNTSWPVRFVGDPVAAVAAVDRHAAEAAIQAIEVGYEPLDFVLDPEQMEPRCAVARWEGDEFTLWSPTQGISNCRADVARDLDLPPERVRVVCEYMGGGFGNKNQCQDADLIAALLAPEAGRPVKLELTRKDDFLGVHGRWPTVQHYKVGASRDGTLQ